MAAKTAAVLVDQQWQQVEVPAAVKTAGDLADVAAASLDVAAVWSLKTDSGTLLARTDTLPPDCNTYELVDITAQPDSLEPDGGPSDGDSDS